MENKPVASEIGPFAIINVAKQDVVSLAVSHRRIRKDEEGMSDDALSSPWKEVADGVDNVAVALKEPLVGNLVLSNLAEPVDGNGVEIAGSMKNSVFALTIPENLKSASATVARDERNLLL